MTGFERDTHSITAAGSRPKVTPDLVEHYVRRGRQERAELIRRGGRRLWSGLAGALGRRRQAGLTTRPAQ